MLFELSEKKIDIQAVSDKLANNEAGAFVSFEGRVRNHNEGKSVLRLDYEAYPELAIKEAEKVMAEAKEQFPIIDAICVHRTGALEIGDIAVWVGVLSRHRGEAFDACRYIIDQIKSRVPIWKKEFYADNSSVWVNCAACSHDHGRKSKSATVEKVSHRSEGKK